MKVYKYPLPAGVGMLPVKMPGGAEYLCVRLQRDIPVLYALVDEPYKQIRTYHVFAVFTGDDCGGCMEQGKYLGTIEGMSALVVHYFGFRPNG